MKIEMINSLDYLDFPGVRWQIEQVKSGKSDELWLATPHEDAAALVKNLGLKPEQVYDMYARAYVTDADDKNGIWFTDLPVPNEAQLVINDDWTKSMVSNGHELAKIRWFANSQRIVQAVAWQDSDGQIDYKDIYQRDGRLFAKQYFSEGELLESDFYIGQRQAQTRDFYFEGQRNFVEAEGKKFPSAEAYLANLGDSFHANQYRITQVGREIDFAPLNSVLTFPEGVQDAQGNIYANLAGILQEAKHKIQHVEVRQADYDLIKAAGLPTDKLSILK
ncbi:glycosyltransferase [Eupransor demetentiae]|uniref:Uncharacterized protein n=1 Tax=Eupransor demetentiae TaxID=3109584 RepID=A0ABM9N4S3_9LACO|nr:hypothetical protein R54876_GBNLAHCA_00744 [Lactobacillaceae bacterium LMG 33000]